MSTSEIETGSTIGETLRVEPSIRYSRTTGQSVQLSATLRDEAHQFYRQSTKGEGLRFPYPSHSTIRAAGQPSPHERFLAFLAAGRAVGKPRHWFEQQVVWVETQVSAICHDIRERDEWLEATELAAENDCNVAELRYRLDRSDLNLMHLVNCLRSESAKQNARLAGLEQEARERGVHV